MAKEAFRGEVTQKVDSKARVSIPAAFRRILDAQDTLSEENPRTRLYMIYGGKKRNFVECYSREGADILAAQIESMELGSVDRERAERDLIARSVMVDIEPDGRIVLPVKVRETMGFAEDDLKSGAEAVFVGSANRFKLYHKDVYEADDDDDDEDDVDPLARVGRNVRVS